MATRLPSKFAIVCACLLALVLVEGAAWADPFPCTGEAFAVQQEDALLNQIDQTVTPFVFEPIGVPAGYLINNLGFRRSDGLLYAYRGDVGNQQIISIDDFGAGSATMLGSGGLPAPAGNPYNSGDISADGTKMYFSDNGIGNLYTIDLTAPGLPLLNTVVVPAIGNVNDYAAHPSNGLLYGGDHIAGELVEVDPETGTRTDKTVAGLPTGTPSFGATWFDAAGTFFLYKNSGTIYIVEGADTATPTLVGAEAGEVSAGFNDGAACIQNMIGSAKQMTVSGPGLPTTLTIEYVVENFSGVETMSDISAIDDLEASFGTVGDDWTFTSISSAPAAFANPGFDGSSDQQLVNQAPTQSLAPLGTASLTVVLELLTDNAANADGELCNQVVLTGTDSSGLVFGDLSTDDPDPDPDGDGFPAEREPTCITVGTPGLELVKDGALDLGGDGVANPGDLINYTFTVTNTGDVDLTDVLVSDPLVPVITCPSGNPIPLLAVMDSEICTGSYAITQADIKAGQRDNTATAESNETPPVTDDHTELIPQGPGLELVKDGTLDLGGDGVANPGDVINYTFTVTNTGNVTLTDVLVSDPLVPVITCPSGNPIPTLAVDDSETCTGSYVITQADIDAGERDNTATADSNETPPVTDDHTEVIPQGPGLELVKTGALDLGGDGVANPGDLINYEFTVTNTGNVTLTDVLISDPMVSPITCPSGNPIPSLAPGDSETCTGSYAITQADIDAGQKDNTATAESNETPPVTDDHTELIPRQTTEIPTLSQWSLAGFAMLLLGFGVLILRRRLA